MIATIFCMAVSHNYAQQVPIPNPNWPLDSVVNGAVHNYIVQGDLNYEDPSTFVWNVDGGRLFFDAALTLMAGDGTTASVTGDANNSTNLWVVWDSFDQPLDTGYVYLYEISADGCERSDLEEGKFQGMQIKVSAPPKVRFLTQETITCSNEDGVLVQLEIEGMPPFDLSYTLNGNQYDWAIKPEDLIDSDFDGEVDNVTFLIDDYPGTTVDMVYDFQLIEASSAGVLGEILPDYPSHMVYAFVQPEAPIITENWLQVTSGQTHLVTLDFDGVEAEEWYWELYDANGTLVFEESTTGQSAMELFYNYPVGDYLLVAYYRSSNGCLSLTDTLAVTIYSNPILYFVDSSLNAIGCSALSIDPNDSFEFALNYEGSLTYDFSFEVYDYNNRFLWGDTLRYNTTRNPIITIPNTFINDELPEIDRIWTVFLTGGQNGEGVEIDIIGDDITGGSDERTIRIHPKPIIIGDIDFYN